MSECVRVSDGESVSMVRLAAWTPLHGPLQRLARLTATCGDHRCANPEHLKIATQNLADEFGDVVYELYVRQGFTQADVAHKLGLYQPQIAKILAAARKKRGL